MVVQKGWRKSRLSERDEFLSEKFQPSLRTILGELFNLYVYIDGRFLKGEEAKVPVWEHAFLYGDGVFEGIRAYQDQIFKLDEHIDRLYDSAKGIGIENVPLSKDEMKQAIRETLKRNRLQDAHVRAIITRGSGQAGLDPKRCVRPSVVIMAYPFPPFLGEKPIRMITASVRRKSPHSVDAKIKSLNYLDNILAKLQAIVAGVDDAVMLDTNGCVAEATAENIFTVKAEKICTPIPTAALHGITRATILELARGLGYDVCERVITPQDLYAADEVFLTGTGTEIASVVKIDGRRIGLKAPGPITKRIQESYRDHVRREHGTPIHE
jgi:branched-chain amino acid aminotransferase